MTAFFNYLDAADPWAVLAIALALLYILELIAPKSRSHGASRLSSDPRPRPSAPPPLRTRPAVRPPMFEGDNFEGGYTKGFNDAARMYGRWAR